MIEVRTGDMLKNAVPKEGVVRIITHGTNCLGRMGSGIAPLIKQLYPCAYEVYREKYKSPESLQLGHITVATPYPEFTFLVVNSNIQEKYRGYRNLDGTCEPYDKVFCDYDAMRNCFKKINELLIPVLRSYDIPVEVHFPLIGCGLAGGDWDIVSKIIDEELDDSITKVLWKLK